MEVCSWKKKVHNQLQHKAAKKKKEEKVDAFTVLSLQVQKQRQTFPLVVHQVMIQGGQTTVFRYNKATDSKHPKTLA